MGESRYVGRVGALAVAFGIGSAVALGLGSGVACADDSDSAGTDSSSPAGSATSSQGNATTHTTDGRKSKDVKKPAKQRASNAADDDADKERDAATAPKGSAADDDAEARDDESDAVPVSTPASRRSAAKHRNAATTDADETSRESKPSDAGNSLPAQESDVEETTVVTETAADDVVEQQAPVVAPLNDPATADTTPEAPNEPQLFALMAFARRELETAFTGPSLRRNEAEQPSIEEQTVSVERATPVEQAASLAAVDQAASVAAVENSLTYTAPPNIVDRVTVFGLRILRTVSNVIGVDLFAEFNKLLISKSPPFFLTFGLNTRKTEVELTDGTTWQVWEFRPPEPTDKTVIAIHGSGFIFEPNLMQWYDYTSMARDTGATVLVPIYPLATTEAGSALNVVPDMADYISSQIDQHGAENVSVYGDSAGSIIAIAAVRQLVLAGKPVPSRMVLLSLTPDGSLSNPDIHTIDDPVIDVDNLGNYGTTHWGDGLTDPGRDPLYNALWFETLVGLPPTTIYVGDLEFVLPDTLLLYQRAVDEGAPISVVVGRGQIHDWALGGLPINSAAPAVRRDVYRQLGL